MTITELQGKRVAILGFGEKEGPATATYLINHGIKPIVLDRKTFSKFSLEIQHFLIKHALEGVYGTNYCSELSSFEVIFRNPDVPRLNPEVLAAEKAGSFITSQAKWFLEHNPAKVIGVTGTKGKGTTSSLIFEALKSHYGERAYLTGNIGLTQPFEILDSLGSDDWVVYELSSFQLQDLTISPHIAVLLMVTSEHLDHHQSIKEYRQAKSNIVAHQGQKDYAIVNVDYEGSGQMSDLGLGQKLQISRSGELVNKGVWINGETILLTGLDQVPTEAALKLSELKLRGQHNLENVAAAILASLCAQVPFPKIIEAAKSFRGLEHRLELVGSKNGIIFYNDSFATTPESSIAAIKAFDEPLIVILGGSEKNSDFSELAVVIKTSQNIKTLILLGPSGERIKKELAKLSFDKKVLEGAASMEAVFEQIKTVAQQGDVVLLSPAAASFDMFKNYKERGQQFKEHVNSYD